MSENKYLDYEGLALFAKKLSTRYVTKDGDKVLSDNNYSDEEKIKLAELENYDLPAAAADRLGGIKIGSGLHIDENGVVNTEYNPEMGVDFDKITDLPTTLDGYGITDAATKEELNKVKEDVSKVYKYKGKVATLAELDLIENPQNGDVYDVEETGINYAWNADEERWDNLGQLFEIQSLTPHDIDIITGSATTPEALIELIEKGGEVFFDNDITLSENLEVNTDTVIDLGGNTLTLDVPNYAFTVNGSTLTLKGGNVVTSNRIAGAVNGGKIIIQNGNYTSGNVGFTATGTGSKLTVDGGNISAREGCTGAFDGAEIEINGGHLEGIDNFPVFTNGTAGRGGNTIVFNDGELVGNIKSANYEACGVYIANNDHFVMNGGTIKSNGGCGILMRAGNVEINDGTIEATTGSNVPGWVGDDKTKMSASAVIYHESANYPGKAGMSLVINGGKFIGADHAVEVLSNEANPNVTINGGDFTPVYPET